MKNHFFIFSFLMIILSSCMNNNTSKNEKPNNDSIAQNQGFTEMQIIEDKKTSCIFLLQDQNKTLYEVQDISTKIPNIKSGSKVWIKFSSLRRMSVCNAQPISITEIFNNNH